MERAEGRKEERREREEKVLLNVFRSIGPERQQKGGKKVNRGIFRMQRPNNGAKAKTS